MQLFRSMRQRKREFSVFVLLALSLKHLCASAQRFNRLSCFTRITIFKRTAKVAYSFGARICATEPENVQRDVLFGKPIVQLFPDFLPKHIIVDISCEYAVRRAFGMTLFSDTTVLNRFFP